MTIYKNNNKYDNSNIILKGDKIVLYDKELNDPRMNCIDYGLSLLKKDSFLEHSMSDFLDLSNIYKLLIEQNKMIGYEVSERFYEIGKPEGIRETEEYLKSEILQYN